jgi:radical SAM superfamily enzyme YgiQ (UPF0313 family)
MRILLIQSYLGRREPPVAPLGLASLAAHLQKHQVKIVDPNVARNPLADTIALVEDYQPDIIGLSLRNIDTTNFRDPFLYYEFFHPYVQAIKRSAPGAIFIVGGSAFSLFPQQIMQSMPEIDFGFHLEAELTLPLFLNRSAGIEQIPGVYYRSSGETRYTGRPESVSMDELNPPAWELLDMAAYLPYTSRVAIGVEGKRGCSLKCAYCTYPTLSGSQVRAKSPSRVVQEIKTLREKFGVDRVFFTDCVFNFPTEHALDICREMIRQNVPVRWSGYHQDRFLTREYLSLAKQAGCEEFYLSPDAATAQGLKIMGKATTVKSLHESLDMFAENRQVKAAYNFFAAIPGLGWSNMLAVVWFLIKARWRLGRRLARYKFSYIRLEPETPLAREVLGDGDHREALLPRNRRQLDRLFYRRSRSLLLNLLLELHYQLGKTFGRKNVLK